MENLALKTNDVEELKRIIEFNDSNLNFFVASNKNCPVSLLEILCNDEDDLVRIAVFRHKNTPLRIVKKLSEEFSLEFRKHF